MIDRTAVVIPPRYADKALRKEMGDLIGKADRDDMLATLLWAGECRIAARVRDGWKKHVARLNREVSEAADRRRPTDRFGLYFWQPRDEVAAGCQEAATVLHAQLVTELTEAREGLFECEQGHFEISRHLGQSLGRRNAGQKAQGFALDSLAPLGHQLYQARERLAQLLARDCEALHELAMQEASRRQSVESGGGTSLKSIDGMTAGAFSRLVQELLTRDGCTLPATPMSKTGVVVARTAAGRTVLVSGHHLGEAGVRPEPESAVPTAQLQQAQYAASQAGAEAVVAVANGRFSHPARRYARTHQILLVGRDDLKRWAEWGQPLDLDADLARGAA